MSWTEHVSRRELLACGFVIGAGAMAASAAAATAATPVTDGALLTYALEIEMLSMFAYQHALGLSDVSGDGRARLAEFLAHEQHHVAVLEDRLRGLGQSLPTPVDTVARANALLSQHGLSTDLGGVRKFEDAIKLLYDIEGLSQGAYWAMAGLLRSSSPLLPAVEALGCEAQHQALLTDLLYPGKVERTVPGPFVEGWQ